MRSSAAAIILRPITPPVSESLIYLSERKLRNMARSRGISTAQFELDLTAEVTGRVHAPIAPGTGVSAAAHAEGRRVDSQQRERRMDRMLDDVCDALNKDGLADLDSGSQTPREGGWFRFHRNLRFGYGSDDDTRSVSALVLVDREPVGEPGRAGLLMNGSPWHLREPYRPDDGAQITGARSGSSTGRLFRWLETVREARESDETIGAHVFDPPLFLSDHSSDGPSQPADMYRLFASDDWMVQPRFPQLLDFAPCAGVAQASLVSVYRETTVVMASPLYVRVLSVPDEEPRSALLPRRRRCFPFLTRRSST